MFGDIIWHPNLCILCFACFFSVQSGLKIDYIWKRWALLFGRLPGVCCYILQQSSGSLTSFFQFRSSTVPVPLFFAILLIIFMAVWYWLLSSQFAFVSRFPVTSILSACCWGSPYVDGFGLVERESTVAGTRYIQLGSSRFRLPPPSRWSPRLVLT